MMIAQGEAYSHNEQNGVTEYPPVVSSGFLSISWGFKETRFIDFLQPPVLVKV